MVHDCVIVKITVAEPRVRAPEVAGEEVEVAQIHNAIVIGVTSRQVLKGTGAPAVRGQVVADAAGVLFGALVEGDPGAADVCVVRVEILKWLSVSDHGLALSGAIWGRAAAELV